MDNQQGPTVLHRELCSVLAGSLDGRGVSGRMGTCICSGWVPLLSTCNYCNIVNQLYSHTKSKIKKKLSWNIKYRSWLVIQKEGNGMSWQEQEWWLIRFSLESKRASGFVHTMAFQGVCFGGLLCCVRLPCVPTTYADFSHEMWDQYSLIKTACNYFRNTWKGQAKMGKDMLSFRPTLHPSTINTQGCCLKYNNHHNGSDGKESSCSVGVLGSILGWEDPLEEGMATHSSILAWRSPVDRGA